jgi:hypothetical protein
MNRTTLTRIALVMAIVFAVTMALLPKPPHMPIDQFGDKFGHLGAMIEVLQAIPSLHRDCDIYDWIADTLAITVVLLIVWAVRRRRGARLN